jgi:acetyl esterase/lipase
LTAPWLPPVERKNRSKCLRIDTASITWRHSRWSSRGAATSIRRIHRGLHALDLGSARANANASAHAFVKTLRRAFARRPTYFAFYVGRGDDRFRDENERFDRELDAAHVPHVFRVYAGGHEQSV